MNANVRQKFEINVMKKIKKNKKLHRRIVTFKRPRFLIILK